MKETNMAAYYNEIEPYAAQWLRNLIKAGHIADGEVDTRSIVDVAPDDIRGFTQAHFFAGIGGWSHALRLAGWPDDRPIWTGSCPCQPFSVAGKGAGVDDPRHLWPHFHRLITAVRPPVVMGEQVAGQAGYGWLDGVRADLEAEGYASRGVDIPACAVDAPHIRSRLYWVAENLGDANSRGCGENRGRGGVGEICSRTIYSGVSSQERNSIYGGDLGDARNAGSQGRVLGRQDQERETEQRHLGRDGSAYGGSHMADAECRGRKGGAIPTANEAAVIITQNGAGSSGPSHMADADNAKRWPHAEGRRDDDDGQNARREEEASGRQLGSAADHSHMADAQQLGDRAEVGAAGDVSPQGDRPSDQHGGRGSAPVSAWSDAVWLTGADGKARRAQPGIPLLAHGIPNRVGKLRAYGNAIVPPLAAEVIGAYMDATS
jgi:DNA (cytosine-5)-methyltransferase 1